MSFFEYFQKGAEVMSDLELDEDGNFILKREVTIPFDLDYIKITINIPRDGKCTSCGEINKYMSGEYECWSCRNGY